MSFKHLIFIWLLLPSFPLNAGWFFDAGIGYNLKSDDDFEGGKEIAVLGIGYEFDDYEVGYGHLSHYLRGWPGERYFGWSGDEEQIDMLYFKRRFRW
ncbi:MAG: hypothetical protein N0E44_18125 [Candidatus Thiodiazotropha lotti]|nr:hypothetical protein [Candidatus Thiodiazotropha lotti]MCW4221801.1 hypothetical protein [Candidatus Thiodiazotropha lotti]